MDCNKTLYKFGNIFLIIFLMFLIYNNIFGSVIFKNISVNRFFEKNKTVSEMKKENNDEKNIEIYF